MKDEKLIFPDSLGSMVAKRSILNGEVRVPALSPQLFGIVCNLSTLSPGEPFSLFHGMGKHEV